MPTIRASRDDDLAAITAIYAHHVLHGTGTFEIDPPGIQDMAARRADVLARGLPYLVAEEDGRVTGFAYCNWFKPRPAYRYSAEDSIYVADHARGRGLGRLLLDALSDACAGRRGAQAAGRDRRLGQRRLHRRAPRRRLHRGGRDALRGLEVRRLARHRAHGETPGRGRYHRARMMPRQ